MGNKTRAAASTTDPKTVETEEIPVLSAEELQSVETAVTVAISAFDEIKNAIGILRDAEKDLLIQSIEDTEQIELAKKGEKHLRSLLTKLKKKHELVKEQYLRPCQAIDKANREIRTELEQILEGYKTKAAFEDIYWKEHFERRRVLRNEMLQPYEMVVDDNLLKMEPDEFQRFLDERERIRQDAIAMEHQKQIDDQLHEAEQLVMIQKRTVERLKTAQPYLSHFAPHEVVNLTDMDDAAFEKALYEAKERQIRHQQQESNWKQQQSTATPLIVTEPAPPSARLIPVPTPMSAEDQQQMGMYLPAPSIQQIETPTEESPSTPLPSLPPDTLEIIRELTDESVYILVSEQLIRSSVMLNTLLDSLPTDKDRLLTMGSVLETTELPAMKTHRGTKLMGNVGVLLGRINKWITERVNTGTWEDQPK